MLKFNAEDAIVSESEKEREELKSEEEKKAKIAAELFDSALALLRSGHQLDIFFKHSLHSPNSNRIQAVTFDILEYVIKPYYRFGISNQPNKIWQVQIQKYAKVCKCCC